MKDLKIYLIIASVLFVLYLTAQYNKPQAIDWTETYSRTDKIPFGTYILYERLHDIFPKAAISTYREPLNSVVNDDSVTNSTYLIINNSIKLSDYDYESLTKYVSQGNNVFIAASYFGKTLMNKLRINTASELDDNSQTYVTFLSQSPGDSTFLVDHNSTNGYFSGFDKGKATVLGKNGYNHPTFIRVNMGKGALYLNANPQIFTNYGLLQPQGAAYAQKALSYLKVQKGLVWDEFYSQGRQRGESSMRVFLSRPPLRWAFYLVCAGLLIYVLYQMKRRQRIIPIIEPLTNTSVDFARVVGQVYYEQRDNANIAQKKVSYFLEHIRSRYNIKTNLHNEEFFALLSQKSGAQITLIKDIFYQVALVQSQHQIDNNGLITLNQNIEQFYFQSS